jgi:non-specific serine/threonine protein kinase
LHGSDKNFDVNVHDLFITTYATSSKISGLSEHCFDLVILDEAQNIKNILTKNTKFIKQLRGKCRIALTGTPIENDLTEL